MTELRRHGLRRASATPSSTARSSEVFESDSDSVGSTMRRPRYRSRRAVYRQSEPRYDGQQCGAEELHDVLSRARSASSESGATSSSPSRNGSSEKYAEQCAVSGDQELAGVLRCERTVGHLAVEVIGGEVEHRPQHAGEVDREVLTTVDRLAADHADVARVVGEEPKPVAAPVRPCPNRSAGRAIARRGGRTSRSGGARRPPGRGPPSTRSGAADSAPDADPGGDVVE